MKQSQSYLFYSTSIIYRKGNRTNIQRPNGALSYLCILLICQSSDIELNPGPGRPCKDPCGTCNRAVRTDPDRPSIFCNKCKIWFHGDCVNIPIEDFPDLDNSNPWYCPGCTRYPCGVCDSSVRHDPARHALCCDNCSIWYHRDCAGCTSGEYQHYAGSNVSWICCKCGVPNYSTTFFDQVTLDTANSFLPLSNIDSAEIRSPTDSIYSFETSDIGSPAYTSSPRQKIKPKHDSNKNLKVYNLNIQSVHAKKESLWELIDSGKPDLIVGCETWLSPSTLSSEILPAGYSTFRTDRADGYGGVLIGVKIDLIPEQIETLKDCELCVVKIELLKKHPLLVIGAYRPTNRDENYFRKLCGEIERVVKLHPNATVWCCGDFNLPDIDWESETISGNRYPLGINETMMTMVHDCNLEQIVTEPTRESNILDLFLTNRPSLVNRCEIVPGISDHDVVYVDSNIAAKRQKPIKRKIQLWDKADFDQIRLEVKSFSEEFTKQHSVDTPVEDLWKGITTKTDEILDKRVPSKTTSSRYSQPWINRKIRSLKRQKQRCYNKAKKSHSPADFARCRELKKQMQSECRKAYSDYMNDIICGEYDTGKKKRFYGYVKSMRTDSCGVAALKSEGITYSENKDKAEILNKQFSSVFTKEDPHIPPPDLGPSPYPSLPDIVVHPPGVAKLLRELNPYKATGPDKVPAKLLKEVADEIAPALALVFQASLKQHKLPSDWKNALVAPLFKKGERYKASNYRPVSLTSICCKSLEHIIHHHIINHLETLGILSDAQHGFRKRRSCETQLNITVDDLARGLNNGKQIDAILLDFSKAFDKVPHQRLRLKLEYYGVRGNTLEWISSFLNGRTQRVLCGGSVSKPADVDSGVPQGSVLGPLLFLAYINDLPDCVASTPRMFADDCLLYRQIDSISDSRALQDDLIALEKWESDWLMSFNPDKCEVLRFTRKTKPIITSYFIHGSELNTVPAAKYLGVTLDSKLTFNQHIAATSKKANSTRAFVTRTTKFCPRKVRDEAYKTFVRPSLEYASTVWSPHTDKNIKKLEAVQRRAARSVMNDHDRTSSVTAMLHRLKWETLEERRAKSRVMLFYKVVTGLVEVTLPTYIIQGSQLTRGHSLRFLVPTVRLDVYKHSFYPASIRLWNGLPAEAVTSASPDAFRARVAPLVLTRSA